MTTEIVSVCLLLFVACGTVRAADQTAPYRTLKRDGQFELREYPALVVAETPMRDSSDGSFMRLFHFIGGRNAAKQKIAMTTPVLISGAATNQAMAFVMPKGMSVTNAPQPQDVLVRLHEISGGTFAVFRFSGGRNEKNQRAALEQLTAWLGQPRLKSEGGPIFGYFDPPWIPTFFRHNEVMLRMAPGR